MSADCKHRDFGLTTDVNESFDVSRLQASRLENLFESEKRLAELRHKQASEVSQSYWIGSSALNRNRGG